MGRGSLRRPLALAAIAATTALVAACSGGGSTGSATGSNASGTPTKGGKLTLLTVAEKIQHLDPQRNYTGIDLAFANAFLQRTLTAYKYGQGEEASEIVGDLAADTGKVSNDGKTWAFTLRDGAAFEDGSPVTCADVKYGVSRVFATTVITDGPQYPVSMLDIPKASDGTSVYKGPYDKTAKNNTAAFDKAVTCSADGKTITFNLNKPVPDFNYTTTLLSFSPVPKAADKGAKYDDKPVSSGPYKIQEYTQGQRLVLVRNDKWTASSDPYRPANPDTIEVSFGQDASAIDQRLITDASGDQAAATHGDDIQPQNLATIFNSDRFKDRRFNELDPYVRYYAINVKKVPNLKHRQAIAAAMDREAVRKVLGGTYAGDFADGLIKPNLPADYKPTGMWDTNFGAKVEPTGNPELAKKLIAESGAPMPTITYDYGNTPERAKEAAAVVEALGKAGITVKPNPIEVGSYYGIVLDPAKAHELMWSGWGPDWLNASTVIPELLTPSGGFNLSQYNNPAFNEKVEAAKVELDRAKQGQMWADLNAEAMKDVPVVPMRFGRAQFIVGSKVGGAYIWAPYGSLPYAQLYVEK